MQASSAIRLFLSQAVHPTPNKLFSSLALLPLKRACMGMGRPEMIVINSLARVPGPSPSLTSLLPPLVRRPSEASLSLSGGLK